MTISRRTRRERRSISRSQRVLKRPPFKPGPSRGKRTLRRLWERISNEAGISLVELLVGVGIAAGIMALIGTFIFQFFTITRNGSERMAVSSDLQSAALWLGRDAAEAEEFTTGSPPTYGSFIAPQTAAEHEYRYRYDSAEQDLVRDLYIDGSLDSSRVVARFIQNQGDVTFSPNGYLVTVTLTSTSGGASETIDLELALRVR